MTIDQDHGSVRIRASVQTVLFLGQQGASVTFTGDARGLETDEAPWQGPHLLHLVS
ncbi:MAG: hypothetical protein ACXVRU_06895 [Gaiellaceae bacterium]